MREPGSLIFNVFIILVLVICFLSLIKGIRMETILSSFFYTRKIDADCLFFPFLACCRVYFHFPIQEEIVILLGMPGLYSY